MTTGMDSVGLVTAARRLAEALVCGFAACHTEGRPLTEVQQADMIASALLAFDGCRAELEAAGLVDQRLRDAYNHTRIPDGPRLRSEETGEPMTAAEERLLDALGDERAYR